jgi:hypothetical protein
MPPLLAVGDFLAVWNLTQPEPGVRRHDEQIRVRLLLRGCASARVAVDLGWFILPNYFHSTLSQVTIVAWAPWVWRVGIATWAAEAGLLFWYLRPLALRLPAPPLAKRMRILAILLPLAFLAAWLCTEPLIGRSRSESTVALVILGALGLWSAKVLFGLFLAIGRIDDGMGADAEY